MSFSFQDNKFRCSQCICLPFKKAKQLYWHLRKVHKYGHDTAFEIVGLEVASMTYQNKPEDRKYTHAYTESMANYNFKK